jgi:hypothetical protein
MVLVGFILSIVFGLIGFPWWSTIFSTLIVLVTLQKNEPDRMNRLGSGGPLMLVWMALPCLGLWYIGSLFG